MNTWPFCSKASHANPWITAWVKFLGTFNADLNHANSSPSSESINKHRKKSILSPKLYRWNIFERWVEPLQRHHLSFDKGGFELEQRKSQLAKNNIPQPWPIKIIIKIERLDFWRISEPPNLDTVEKNALP